MIKPPNNIKPKIPIPYDEVFQEKVITISNSLQDLKQVRHFLIKILVKAKMPKELASHIEMALDEALANVIEHYLASISCTIDIIISYNYHFFICDMLFPCLKNDTDETPFLDHIKKVSPSRIKQKIHSKDNRGYGNYVIVSFIDEVLEWENQDKRKIIRLVKKIPNNPSLQNYFDSLN